MAIIHTTILGTNKIKLKIYLVITPLNTILICVLIIIKLFFAKLFIKGIIL